jgi:hypothetical protein
VEEFAKVSFRAGEVVRSWHGKMSLPMLATLEKLIDGFFQVDEKEASAILEIAGLINFIGGKEYERRDNEEE